MVCCDGNTADDLLCPTPTGKQEIKRELTMVEAQPRTSRAPCNDHANDKGDVEDGDLRVAAPMEDVLSPSYQWSLPPNIREAA